MTEKTELFPYFPQYAVFSDSGLSPSRKFVYPLLARFVIQKDGIEPFLLSQFSPIVLLGGAPIFASREPKLEPDSSLNVAPLRPSLEFVPAVEARAWNVLKVFRRIDKRPNRESSILFFQTRTPRRSVGERRIKTRLPRDS